MINEITVQYILFAAAILSIFLPQLSGRISLPILSVAARWIRWFLIAAVFSFVLYVTEWSLRPVWVHLIVGAGLWFLLETAYNWIAIKALSNSELPLFPSFRENREGDEWPADKKAIDLKDWLREHGFRQLTALKADLFEGTYLRSSIYESQDQLTRIQVLFLPKRKGDTAACFSINSVGQNDERLITDNHFLPFGGYYPAAWSQLRKPLIGSLPALMKLHQRRLEKSSFQAIAFEDKPLDELNYQQRKLERLNLESGFLVPTVDQEFEGRISYEGRYRLWKEMWMLAYLGKPVS